MLAIGVALALQLAIYIGLYLFIFRDKMTFGGRKESYKLRDSENDY